MDENGLRRLLGAVRQGDLSPDDALSRLRAMPFEQIGFARVDHHRAVRCGLPEVVYCPGKTPAQVREIVHALSAGEHNVLATRAAPEVFEAVRAEFHDAEYDETARTIVLRRGARQEPVGHIAVCCGGTSDLPVAEEARITAETFGQRVTTHYDVGVAGLHRLLADGETIQRAHVVVAVAGMEGALASVLGGLVAVPVIAVPTSVGYGASFGGVSALLTMLNSCASNVSVVNIDNGFAGGYIASLINRQASGKGE